MVAQGGTSISSSSRTSVRLVHVVLFGGLDWNADAGGWGGVGTLLGPEGAGDVMSNGSSAPAPREIGVLSYVWDRPHGRTASGLSGRWVLAPWYGVGSARSLRTAQWTRASLFSVGQVFKGARWMPWHQEPMKDVGACDKPRGAGNRAVIRGCPNGETRLEMCPVTRT